MGNIQKRYTVYGWKGEKHFLTAEELYERVMKDSKSNYNWIASATELVRICEQKDFPKKYSQDIKIAILNCFASVEMQKLDDTRRLDTDDKAIYSCYNSLLGTDEKVVAARQKYLKAIIKAVAMYHFELPIHSGPIYLKLCKEWVESKFEQNATKESIDFKILIKELNDDFDNTIRTAENEGVFKKEDEERIKKMADYAFKLSDLAY